MFGVIRTLSLIPSWSGIKASLGAVSGVVVEVTHSVPSPGSMFEATQPAGRAGAITPSKFSLKIVPAHVAVGVAVPPAVAVAVAVALAFADAVAVAVAVGVGGPAVAVEVGLAEPVG